MTPGRLWWLLQRDLKRGWSAAWHDYLTTDRILVWRNPHANKPVEACPVHVLTGREQFRMTLWMLASWFHFTGRNWQVVVHDDGTLNQEHQDILYRLFPNTVFWSADSADQRVFPLLENHPRCLSYRLKHPLARKVFDIPLLTTAPRFLIFDSDVIFFKSPRQILCWVDRPDDDSCWFNRDFQEPSPVPLEDLAAKLGFSVWEKVNSGLCLLNLSSIDITFCERAFVECDLMSLNLWRIEQTLFALCASRSAKGGLLPPAYEVSLGEFASPGVVARHYVGAVRDRFYADGISRIAPLVVPRKRRF